MRREYFASRPRIAAMVGVLLAFVLFGAGTLLAAGLRSPDVAQNDPVAEAARVAAVGIMIFFGVPMLGLCPMLVTRAPLLVIDDEGVIESGAALGMSMGRIRFAEMSDVRAFRVGLGFVGIHLVDADEFLRGAPVLRRFTVRVNQITRYPPITILVASMGVSADDLAAEIVRARAAAASTPPADEAA